MPSAEEKKSLKNPRQLTMLVLIVERTGRNSPAWDRAGWGVRGVAEVARYKLLFSTLSVCVLGAEILSPGELTGFGSNHLVHVCRLSVGFTADFSSASHEHT